VDRFSKFKFPHEAQKSCILAQNMVGCPY